MKTLFDYFNLALYNFNFRNFKNVPNNPGIYWIIKNETNKTYVGSSIDLKTRLKANFFNLEARNHHSKELRQDYIKSPDDFKFKFKNLNELHSDLDIENQKLLKLELSAIKDLVDLGISTYNQQKNKTTRGRRKKYSHHGEKYLFYSKKKPNMRVSLEEKEIINKLRNNSDFLDKIRKIMESC